MPNGLTNPCHYDSDDDWALDVADHDATFTAITARETNEPKVKIEMQTTCQIDTCLVQDENSVGE